MILFYPLILIVACVQLQRRLARGGRIGWRSALAWSFAMALLVISLITGLSIGLFLLPLVVLAFVYALILVR